MAPATRRAFVHPFQLGADLEQGKMGVGDRDTGDEGHQPVLWRPARGAFDQGGFGDALAHQPMHRAPQPLDRPVMPFSVNHHGIGTLVFHVKGTLVWGGEGHAGKRPIRRSWSGLHSLIGCG